MNVLAFNGSPHDRGNTSQALSIVMEELQAEKIETTLIHVGGKQIRGCLACNECLFSKDEKCILKNDAVNDWIQQIKRADGILLGSPVHYADIGATFKAFLDRAFYVAGMNGNLFRQKIAAALVAVRRTGGLTALNQLNHYLNCSEMIIPTSTYWNVIHGAKQGEVLSDKEGVQTLQQLGKNMAYLLKMTAEKTPPEKIKKTYTNFIRK